MIMIGGFVPWAFKYVNSKHAGVATEWQMADVISVRLLLRRTTMWHTQQVTCCTGCARVIVQAYNAYVSADACCYNSMSNAAFYTHYPLQERYIQNPAPTPAVLETAGYFNTSTATVTSKYCTLIVGCSLSVPQNRGGYMAHPGVVAHSRLLLLRWRL